MKIKETNCNIVPIYDKHILNIETFYKIFYVSSVNGNDLNSGESITNAFKSINRAKIEVSKFNFNMTGDIAVLIEGGDYFLETPLIISLREGGFNGYNVIYSRYDNKQVNIFGGKLLKEFKYYKDGIYCTYIEDNLDVKNIFEDGKRAHLAQMPKKNYNFIEDVDYVDDIPRFTYSPNDYNYSSLTGDLSLFCWPGSNGFVNYNWWSNIIPIKEIDTKTRTIKLNNRTTWKLAKNNRYYIFGAKEFLTDPGEFWIDKCKKILYYKPYGDIVTAKIVLPCVMNTVSIDGKESIAQNIVLDGLNISYSNSFSTIGPQLENTDKYGLIYINNAKNILIKNCVISNSGTSGISINGYAQNIDIKNNYIFNLGAHGIVMQGYDIGICGNTEDEGYVNKNNLLRNNNIQNIGFYAGHGSGIFIKHSGDNVISNNYIKNSIRNGIYLLDTGYAFMPKRAYGKDINWENHYNFLYCRNNLVYGNEITEVLVDGQDAGAIYMFGTGLNNILDNNYIHDVVSGIDVGATMGIYLDDASDHVTIINNIVERLCNEDVPSKGNSWAFCIKGIGIKLINNVAAFNATDEKYAPVYICRSPENWYEVDMKAMATTDIIIKNNLFYEPNYKGQKFQLYTFWSKNTMNTCHPRTEYYADENITDLSNRGLIKESDNNIIYASIEDLENNIYICDWSKNFDIIDFNSIWLKVYSEKYNFDKKTIVGNPKIKSASAGCYILKDNRFQFNDVKFDKRKIGVINE